MSALWAILGSLAAAIALVLGGLFGGVRIERARQGKQRAEEETERLRRIDHVSDDAEREAADILSMPSGHARRDRAREALRRALGERFDDGPSDDPQGSL